MKINGKEYQLPELGFREVRKLKKLGIDIMMSDASTQDPLDLIAGVVALATRTTTDAADTLIEEHVRNGGADAFTELMEDVGREFAEAVKNSPFFQSLSRQGEVKKEAAEKIKTTEPSTS